MIEKKTLKFMSGVLFGKVRLIFFSGAELSLSYDCYDGFSDRGWNSPVCYENENSWHTSPPHARGKIVDRRGG